MASFTSPVIHGTSDVLAVTDYNGVANNTTFLAQAPYAVYYNSVSQGIADSTTTQVTLAATSISNYGFSLVSDNAIVPIAGIYWVSGAVYLTSGGSSGGLMNVNIYQNGTAVAPGPITPTGLTNIATTAQGLVSCNPGDTLGLYVFQNSSTTLNTATGLATSLQAFFIGFQ